MVRKLSAMVTGESSPVRCFEVTQEFDYASGRTDLVGLGYRGTLHAFETKLTKWREALDQARRNGCFAHYCYVALPERVAHLALHEREEFRRHGVGLLVLAGKRGRLAIRPRKNDPLLPWLTESALALLAPDQGAQK